ncbi:MAG: hypothetical protein KatS3mg131_1445 [Candidatus Tectimicrobiota bacterium]|nr:MAG: hypothetical protein KatS3mg131_1445 [Candidatus Tectomicrobia bacterium]
MGTKLLEARGLCKAFGGIRAVDHVSLSLAPGELCALIGPNGAGKTTLFHLLTGLLRPDAGTVHLRGKNITAWSPPRIWRRGLSRTFQLPEVFPYLSVLENVQVALLSAARQTFVLLRDAALLWHKQASALLAEVGPWRACARPSGHLALRRSKTPGVGHCAGQ